jgi:NADH:ubiquinone oxidoreductase subunit 6 (subunit J)
VAFDIVFYILAVISVAAALAVIFLRDVFRAALALILLFLVIAGIYVTLHADFLAVVQILVYVGAISILLIVGIMLTRDVHKGNPSGRLRIPAIIVGVLLLTMLVITAVSTDWMLSSKPPLETTVGTIGESLFGEGGYILPVEITAILLLSAVLGAIVLIREK